jgi:hypothetical protein
MVEAGSSEMLVNFCQTACLYTPQGSIFMLTLVEASYIIFAEEVTKHTFR